MQLSNLRFINGGYCIQNLYFSGVRSFCFRRFYAVFLQFQHPVHGCCYIDTGYGPAIREATRKFPFRIMRWLTPIPKKQTVFEPGYPKSLGIDSSAEATIFISHFHADHIGATRLFPNARFVYRSDTMRRLNSLTKWQQLDEATVMSLLPDDFVQRGVPIEESAFEDSPMRCAEFRSLDYWGDGSLILIDLPGHAIGHTGYILNTDQGPRLYVVDAFWDRSVFESGRKLPWLSRRILNSYEDTCRTNEGIHKLVARTGMEPIACHCPETQKYV
ncbi:hypothetical protein LOC67_00215 [Stieleria sp. JC731]|uniref:hypothetical protein n=1 Tax=Pirellulaceae TaxID=2691357 RepID=UPI001E6233DE|nr:hypothetical protein [Stieleria sp. JC731]MCC9598963.1 hypothetical protein [Stieleria sp. JC731]